MNYQDEDPLHGHGKAIPHPKRPTSYTYRGGRLGTLVSVEREQLTKVRTKAVASGKHFGIATLIAICANLVRRGARNR